MKLFLALLLLAFGVCIACASKSTSSQTPKSATPLPSPTPTPSTDAVVSDKLPCSLVMHQAPVLNGLRLGMTPEQVLALFPGSKGDAGLQATLSRPKGPFGTSNFAIQPDKYESKEKFAGVRQITLKLLDDHVSNLRIGYNGPEYSHVDKFVAKFSEGTSLPADGWEPYVGMDNNLKILKCKDFEIQLFTGGPGGNLNYVEIRDLVADKTLKDRRAKAKAKATP
jgi:hypothetical protein